MQYLPGIGPKSAQRIAFYLLEQNRDKARTLAKAMERAANEIGRCLSCRTFSEADKCPICEDMSRDQSQICVVENPLDILAIEQTPGYRGYYFVLMGRLSPLDGISAESIGIPFLDARLSQGQIKEMIVATGTTIEGEATSHYLKELANRRGVSATRIAYGVPVGGELEFVDSSTLSRALTNRQSF
ncbi:MAG: recombination protein RecR [Proteobacteria bacterium]|nr:recombination protein RecR [Pseudomonadota bacterium]